MTKTTKVAPTDAINTADTEGTPTYQFLIFQNKEHPRLYTAQYLRDGVLLQEIVDQAYIVCAAVLEKKLRLGEWL